MQIIHYAYIDDSADRDRQRVVVAGAIIGNKNEWGMLNGKWKARLKQDNLQYFKSSHCETLNGQFHRFRAFGFEEGKRRAIAIRDNLYEIIENSPVALIGVTLSIPFHRKMCAEPERFGRIPSVPYRLVFQQVLAECAKAMLILGRGNIVTFGHDNGHDFSVLHELYKEFKRLNPQYSKIMADFVPVDDEVCPPVQAADVAAWVTFQHANDHSSNQSVLTPKHLRNRMYKIVNWLDNPLPHESDFTTDEAPAKAQYAP